MAADDPAPRLGRASLTLTSHEHGTALHQMFAGGPSLAADGPAPNNTERSGKSSNNVSRAWQCIDSRVWCPTANRSNNQRCRRPGSDAKPWAHHELEHALSYADTTEPTLNEFDVPGRMLEQRHVM
jgi:hypothetical protein